MTSASVLLAIDETSHGIVLEGWLMFISIVLIVIAWLLIPRALENDADGDEDR